MPGVQLANYRDAYVACHVVDDRNLCPMIAKQLSKYGITATTGVAPPAPDAAVALITYDDTWTWDVTTYLLTLRIDVRDPATTRSAACKREPQVPTLAPHAAQRFQT